MGAQSTTMQEGRLPKLASYETVNRFRRARGLVLRRLIDRLSDYLERDLRILDVGGRPDYWLNVGLRSISKIELLNLSPMELDRPLPPDVPRKIFASKVGDARNLEDYESKSIDLVHSNSVIEHVGDWSDMVSMAQETIRVGRAGWVQTPAWGFPFEPHFRVPIAHWFSRPVQAKMLSLSCIKAYRVADPIQRRQHVERINLLTRREVETLFPCSKLYIERILVPKSYSAYWVPEGMSDRI